MDRMHTRTPMELGALTRSVEERLDVAFAAAKGMWARDHTVWDDDPTEIADRLGWLDAPERAADDAPGLVEIASRLAADGVTDAVLVGMGGSSLYPAVLADARADAVLDGAQRLRLHVLDSTDPAAVAACERSVDWGRTVLVPASKSGTTLETLCHLARFARHLDDAGPGGARIVAITDPSSPLDARARGEGWHPPVAGQPDVGGRFAALTPFGLFPAALVGIDPLVHAAAAHDVLGRSRGTERDWSNPVVLGAALAAGVVAGRDKLTVLLPDEIARFGAWIEQLVAESTGKRGTGIVPVIGEHPQHASFGEDRLVVAMGEHDGLDELEARGVPVVRLRFDGAESLGAEVARWQVATAIGGALLGINPFDQPDVAAAKDATARMLSEGTDLPDHDDPSTVLSTLRPGDYLAVLGYVAPGSDDEATLRAAADRFRARHDVPVTIGIGPRYLHSTGQLHKGGPDSGVFLIAVGDDPVDLDIPGRDVGFSRIKRAQAAGDIAALRDRGRRVAHVPLELVGG